MDVLFSKVASKPQDIICFHYACSEIGNEPQVYNISVLRLSSMKTVSFSRVDVSERKLLGQFGEFLVANRDAVWVGWNCLTPRFGLVPILKRMHRITSYKASEPEATFDLDEVFQRNFGVDYVSGPKLESSMLANRLTMMGFLPGTTEAELGNEELFDDIQGSTERKVRGIAQLLRLAATDKLVVASPPDEADEAYWIQQHPVVVELARHRMAAGEPADAVNAVMKDINSRVKAHHKARRARELDGVDLMRQAFGGTKSISLTSRHRTESNRNIQEGYMQIFAGAMQAIRNPKAHANVELAEAQARRLLGFASLLEFKLDEAGVRRIS